MIVKRHACIHIKMSLVHMHSQMKACLAVTVNMRTGFCQM